MSPVMGAQIFGGGGLGGFTGASAAGSHYGGHLQQLHATPALFSSLPLGLGWEGWDAGRMCSSSGGPWELVC